MDNLDYYENLVIKTQVFQWVFNNSLLTANCFFEGSKVQYLAYFVLKGAF